MNLPRFFRAAAGLAALATGTAALAHAGHGLTAPDHPMHMLEAEHVLGLLAALVLGGGVLLLRAIRRRRSDRSDCAERTDRDSGRHAD